MIMKFSVATAILLKTSGALALQAASTLGTEASTVALRENRTSTLEAVVSEDSEAKPPPPDIICIKNDKRTKCVDPHSHAQCKPGSSKKAAITFTFDQYIEWSFNESWYKSVSKAAQRNNADLVLLLPGDEAPYEKSSEQADSILKRLFGRSTKKKHGRIPIPKSEIHVIKKYFKIVKTPWVVPPGLSEGVPREGGCCGAREFMKLAALSLTEYDAVVNLDTDMSIVGSIQPLFDCAASGRFLTARGSMSGTNGGMFAVKPSKALLYDILIDLSTSVATEEDGWNGRGLAPQAKYGSSGLQGFLYYFFYQKEESNEHVLAGQVDPCQWTGAVFCDKKKTCKESPLRHKIKCNDGKDDM